jgi:hypothetical protein
VARIFPILRELAVDKLSRCRSILPSVALPFALQRRRASATTSGHSSACDFRPLLAGLLALAFARAAQLGDEPALFILHEGAEDPAHHLAAEIVAVG